TFTLLLASPLGATLGHNPGTVTIVDNDNPIPALPPVSSVTAATSTATVGGVDLSWTAATAPSADWPITAYQYRMSTDGGTTYGAWTSTGTTSTSFTHICGEGVSCTYQIRAINGKGVAQVTGQATATGLAD